MKVLMATFVLCAFCVFGLSYGSMPDNPEHRERYALLKMIEYCDLVVKGDGQQYRLRRAAGGYA